MSPERWQRIEQIYYDALERADEERAQFLAQACADDATLIPEIEALLAANEQASGFLTKPAMQMRAQEIAAETEAPQSRVQAGQQLSHYKILSPIGAGGMGEVWLAFDKSLQRKVALKLLPPNLINDDERVRRFEQEARAISALNHPNIITVHQVGQSDGLHYFVTEFVDGKTLRQQLSESNLPLSRALEVAIQIAMALSASHEVGIIHRDIKPENVMIRRDGFIKVLDFGLVKLTERRRDHFGELDFSASTVAQAKTGAGTVLGTAKYMSPEQARGLEVDARSDIFSLGAVLYEMLVRRAPFQGKTTMDVLAAILEREPAPLEISATSSGDPAVPNELQRIVSKTLRKDREARYQTVADLLVDLRHLSQEIEFQRKLGHVLPSYAGTNESVSTQPQQVASRDAKQLDTADVVAETTQSNSSIKIILGEIKRHKTGAGLTLALLVALLSVSSYSLYKLVRFSQNSDSFQKMKLTRVTSTGDIGSHLAALAPNGKYVAYVVQTGGQESLVAKQVTTNSSSVLLAPAVRNFRGLTFSRDSDYVYFVMQQDKSPLTLYRIALIGGVQERVLEHVEASISFSPDGRQFAYVNDTYSELLIANIDGSIARSVLKMSNNERLIHPTWSPDGKHLACAHLVIGKGTYLLTINLQNGTRKTVGEDGRWAQLGGLSWVRDGSGLVLSAVEKGTRVYQLWLMAYPDGKLRRLTNDLSNYYGVSVASESDQLVTVRGERIANIWVTSVNDTQRAQQLTFESGTDDGMSGIAWAPDGHIVYAVKGERNNNSLWIINTDGSQRRLLLGEPGNHTAPSFAPDGRFLAFASTRGGGQQLWLMDLANGALRQLTDQPGGVINPRFTPDGRWVFYTYVNEGSSSIFKIPSAGGIPIQVAPKGARSPVVSPDGESILYKYVEDAPGKVPRLALRSLAEGAPSRFFIQPPLLNTAAYRWMPDGRGIAYVDASERVYNLWNQPLNGGSAIRLTDFNTGWIVNFEWSPDRRRVALSRGQDGNDAILLTDFR